MNGLRPIKIISTTDIKRHFRLTSLIDMKDNYIENEFVELWIEDGMVMQCFKPALKTISVEVAKKIVQDRIRIMHARTMPLFVDVNKAISMNKDTREYFASPESIQWINASAFLIHNPVSMVGAKLFLNFNKPKVKTEIFTDKDKALNWLKQYRQ